MNEVKSDGTLSVPNNIGKLDWFIPKMGSTFIFTHFSKATQPSTIGVPSAGKVSVVAFGLQIWSAVLEDALKNH